jgi:transcriptional regulator with XRE-family HTH domain
MVKPVRQTAGELIRSLRTARGITGAELARKIGTTKETIHKIEKGLTLQSGVLPDIARELGVPIEELLTSVTTPKGSMDVERTRARTAGFARVGEGIPLYSSVEGAEGTIWIVFEAIDYLRRPAPLMHVQGAYALLVDGNSMVPALEPGDIALVNPRLFPRKGMNTFFLQDGQERVKGSLKRYEGQSDRVWRAFQWQPNKAVTYEKTEWPIVHSVVGKYGWR